MCVQMKSGIEVVWFRTTTKTKGKLTLTYQNSEQSLTSWDGPQMGCSVENFLGVEMIVWIQGSIIILGFSCLTYGDICACGVILHMYLWFLFW